MGDMYDDEMTAAEFDSALEAGEPVELDTAALRSVLTVPGATNAVAGSLNGYSHAPASSTRDYQYATPGARQYAGANMAAIPA